MCNVIEHYVVHCSGIRKIGQACYSSWTKSGPTDCLDASCAAHATTAVTVTGRSSGSWGKCVTMDKGTEARKNDTRPNVCGSGQ